MSLITKDSRFDLDKLQGPSFARRKKNTEISGLFENNKSYYSTVHKLSYSPQGSHPETKRRPNNISKYTDNLPQ
jgi:hypothetical protein